MVNLGNFGSEVPTSSSACHPLLADIALSYRFRGYLGNPEANQEAFTSDGWLRTGDIVTRNVEGFLWIVDRKKEFIKYKGFQG